VTAVSLDQTAGLQLPYSEMSTTVLIKVTSLDQSLSKHMNEVNPYWENLEAALSDTSGIIVPRGKDEARYFESLRSSIRSHATAAEKVSATVVEPGFRHRQLGSRITGYLLARSGGYWLVFEPDEGEYYCFWGPDADSLGAYGVCGNPLYCWWD
jgi:hypothetical protein